MIPDTLQTQRLLLRCWRPEDAAALVPVLGANVEHLLTWIPDHVAKPVPLAELEARLAGFATAFHAGGEWRYGIFSLKTSEVLGEASLFPRADSGRVPFANADRLEIGYWLRADATGHGYATEAARALLELARAQTGMFRVEIRCDARNLPSAAVPKRLGFQRATAEAASAAIAGPADGARVPGPHDMIWYYPLTDGPTPAPR